MEEREAQACPADERKSKEMRNIPPEVVLGNNRVRIVVPKGAAERLAGLQEARKSLDIFGLLLDLALAELAAGIAQLPLDDSALHIAQPLLHLAAQTLRHAYGVVQVRGHKKDGWDALSS